jgi:hypothetical protein
MIEAETLSHMPFRLLHGGLTSSGRASGETGDHEITRDSGEIGCSRSVMASLGHNISAIAFVTARGRAKQYRYRQP